MTFSQCESVGIDLNQEAVPDETTICKFRHLMENHNLGEELFRLVKAMTTKVHDSQALNNLLHGDERRVSGDSAYTDRTDRSHSVAPKAKDITHKRARRNRPLTKKYQ